MPNAIEMFRAQRDAADQVHARLNDVASLLHELHAQVLALAGNRQLRELVHEEQTLVARTEALVRQIHHLREQEVNRYWPALWRRWSLALVFALASAWAAGAGYAWAERIDVGATETPRTPAGLAAAVQAAMNAMSPAERRQFASLMQRQMPHEPEDAKPPLRGLSPQPRH